MDWVSRAINDLSVRGYFIGADALPIIHLNELSELLNLIKSKNLLIPAGVGKGENYQTNSNIRTDKIAWIGNLPQGEDQKILENKVTNFLDLLRNILNRKLFLGLESFEGHFAQYDKGGFYLRHLDSFRSDDSRMISMIIYLNDHWQQKDGGCLRIFGEDESYIDVPPKKGTIVLFESRRILHEVLPSTNIRESFTVWFKVRSLK